VKPQNASAQKASAVLMPCLSGCHLPI